MEKTQDHNDCVTTNKPIVDVRDEEIKRLTEENDKLRKENEQLNADLKLQTSLYKFECDQRQSLCHRIEAIKSILEI